MLMAPGAASAGDTPLVRGAHVQHAHVRRAGPRKAHRHHAHGSRRKGRASHASIPAAGSAAARAAGSRVGARGTRRTHRGRRSAAALVSSSTSENTAEAIANALATPCENTELTPEPGNLPQVEAATLCLINQERARSGELPLVENARLQQAAQSHDEEMIGDDYFAHVSPSGETPAERVESTGYVPSPKDGYTIGENIAWGTLSLSTPAAVVSAWIASPEHLANILYGAYRDTAIAVVPAAPASLSGGQPGATYAQEFGVIVP